MQLRIKKNSLTIKTLFYLVSFSIIILLLLWIIQVGFLKLFYERYQINNIEKTATQIINYEGDLANKLEALAYESDICIEVYYGEAVYSYNAMNRDCLLRSKNNAIINAKGELLQSSNARTLLRVGNPVNNSKSVIYGIRLDAYTYIFLNTKLEDVNSTNAVLKGQLIYITLVVIILAIFASYFVSLMLNKPILKITEKARQMTVGNYEADMEDYGIAEINELNAVLNYARSEVKNTDELRRDLMANVSHDLKTPLTMIKAYAEMAGDINKNDAVKRKENLDVIVAEADRLNILVNDVLELSKMQSGKTKLKVEDYDLVKEINEILKRYEIIKEMEKYKFVVKMPKTAIVRADKSKLNQVIYNLINNAINYTGDDLTVKIVIKEEKNRYLVDIIDSGKGIAKEEIPLIWTKYYKDEKNHQRHVVGTGLGLSIVKNTLTEHHFTFGVDSKRGKGSRFYFYINKGKSLV